jgi:hypothetical protein
LTDITSVSTAAMHIMARKSKKTIKPCISFLLE